MKKCSGVLRVCRDLLIVVAGNVIYALAVKLFLLPGGLASGGTTGMALAVNALTGIPVSAFVFVFNVLMLLVGLAILGAKFAATTVVSTFVYPIALEGLNRLFGDLVLTTDPLLCMVFSGLGIGIGLGVVIRSGASTGGMDIPPLVLRRFFGIPVSVSLYAFDLCILLAQAVVMPAEAVLYGIVLTFVYTVVLDRVLLFGAASMEVKVISTRSEEIRMAILGEVDRGVTMLSAQGGYMRDSKQVVMSVISSRELPGLQRLIHAIDPECFMVVSRVTEVHGRGFTLGKLNAAANHPKEP